MQIHKRIHLLASGALGTGMTHALDCNVYLLDGGSEYAVIDAGVGQSVPDVLAGLDAAGLKIEKLRYLLLTHGHLDHSGGCRAFHDRLGVAVCCSTATAEALENGDEEAISLNLAKRAGLYAASFRLEPCPIARRLMDGDLLQIGECTVQVVRTPGHSSDMLSFLVHHEEQKLLFCGDTIFQGGKILLSNIPDCSIQDYARTVARLSELEPDALFPGHQLWTLRDASAHIKTAMGYFNRLLLPPNLL
jgi:hydroxyacylglutathione hydrolase